MALAAFKVNLRSHPNNERHLFLSELGAAASSVQLLFSLPMRMISVPPLFLPPPCFHLGILVEWLRSTAAAPRARRWRTGLTVGIIKNGRRQEHYSIIMHSAESSSLG